MKLSKKTKSILAYIGLVLFLVLQAFSSVPGITDQGVAEGRVTTFLGIGAVLGFFIGLGLLSKANPNPHKMAAFVAFLIVGVAALLVNLYRGYIASDFGFNIVSIIALAYLPLLLLGAIASRL